MFGSGFTTHTSPFQSQTTMVPYDIPAPQFYPSRYPMPQPYTRNYTRAVDFPVPNTSQPFFIPTPVGVPVLQPMFVPFDRPCAVPVPQLVPVPVDRPCAVPVPQLVPVPVDRPCAVPVDRPYPVPVDRPYAVPVDRPYPVPVDRPYAVSVDRPYPVPVDRPYAVPVDRPYAVPVPVPQPYVVQEQVPVPVPVPVAVPMQAPQIDYYSTPTCRKVEYIIEEPVRIIRRRRRRRCRSYCSTPAPLAPIIIPFPIQAAAPVARPAPSYQVIEYVQDIYPPAQVYTEQVPVGYVMNNTVIEQPSVVQSQSNSGLILPGAPSTTVQRQIVQRPLSVGGGGIQNMIYQQPNVSSLNLGTQFSTPSFLA